MGYGGSVPAPGCPDQTPGEPWHPGAILHEGAWGTRNALLVLLVLLFGGGVLAASLGSVSIPLGKVAGLLANQLPLLHLSPTWTASQEAIILQIRLPRVVAAVVVGGGLAVAGVVFQGLLRNPMADP